MTTTIRNGRGDLITAIGGPCDVQALPESQLPELAVLNRPGMSGDSSSWKGWGHVRWFIEEVPAGAA
ncbi:hypothetical protein ACNJTZ_20710 [Mycobacterium tuberculosis]